jgi:hypothetical protein
MLLLKLAKELSARRLATFAPPRGHAARGGSGRGLGDPLFDALGLSEPELRDVAAQHPSTARAMVLLYRAYVSKRTDAQALAERIAEPGFALNAPNGGLPSEEVSDFIQRTMNHYPSLESIAERVCREAKLDSDDVYAGLTRYLASSHGIQVRLLRVSAERKAMRRFDPERKLLSVSEVLPPRSRRFQLAFQVALAEASDAFESILADAKELTTREAHALARVALANYFAAAILMPYAPSSRRAARSATTSSYSAPLWHQLRAGLPSPHHPAQARSRGRAVPPASASTWRATSPSASAPRASASPASAAPARDGTCTRRS